MGKYLIFTIVLQLACAIYAASLGRPAIWLHAILLIPLIGSLAFCGFEIRQGLARQGPSRPAAPDPATAPVQTNLGWLGYHAVRARTADGRRALAEECMRVGRHADARLLFKSCMVGRHSHDPRLIAGMERATALMDLPARSTDSPTIRGASIAP